VQQRCGDGLRLATRKTVASKIKLAPTLSLGDGVLGSAITAHTIPFE
jgi:hypothetical protein